MSTLKRMASPRVALMRMCGGPCTPKGRPAWAGSTPNAGGLALRPPAHWIHGADRQAIEP